MNALRSHEREMREKVNPQMIVLAREARGMRQEELAQRAGLSQAEVSRYETGDRLISDAHLDAIADVLRYPHSFFMQPDSRYGLGSSGLHHRKRKSLPSRTLDMFIAKVNIVRLAVSQLLEGVDIEHPNRFPVYDPDDFGGDIERIADIVRAAWKLPAGPVVDLVGAIENAGGIVHVLNFGTEKIDALVQWVPPAPPILLINESFPGDRLRFTLAHEIGHLVMHDAPRENMEEEADRFASAFLMPERDISADFDHVTLSRLAQLKPYWRVSIAALIRRARDLNKISERQYRSLYEEMGKMGYRTREPLPIPIEKPTLLHEIVANHITELKYSVGEVAKLVSLNEDEFRAEFLPRSSRLSLVPPR